ncbi:MAG: hypothetical protein HQK83_12450 [Fibrobacteria bacterium]|nr:hypothetical protein [Fibrobacteria bacterium]
MNDKTINDLLLSKNKQNILQALSYLEHSGSITHIRTILKLLKTVQEPEIKQACIKAASHNIRHNLLENYSEMNQKTRRGLVQILKALDPQIVNSISHDLKSKDDDKRFNAIRILSLMGRNPQVKKVLKDLITDRNEMVRATAVSLLKNLPESVDANLLSVLLKDNDPRVVANTIEVIEALQQSRLAKLLINFKSHINNRIRGNAIKALWSLGQSDIFESLKLMLDDHENFLMRASGCWVIGEKADDSDFNYLELLSTCARDEERLVRENVIKAQIKIGGDAVDIYQKRLSNAREVAEVRRSLSEQ